MKMALASVKIFVTEESSETQGLKLLAEVKEGELQHRAGCEIQKS